MSFIKQKLRVLGCVIVYDRLDTLSWWLWAWMNSNTQGVPLHVIHNYDGESPDPRFRDEVEKWDGRCLYVPRPNIGMDIAALRDKIREDFEQWRREPWDILFWATDDTIPIRKNFLDFFVTPLYDTDVGMVANYISLRNHWPEGAWERVFTDHARTVGFSLRREAALQILWKPSILTKEDCWYMELWSCNIMYQLQLHGYQVVAASGNAERPFWEQNDILWDTGSLYTANEKNWNIQWLKFAERYGLQPDDVPIDRQFNYGVAPSSVIESQSVPELDIDSSRPAC